MAEGLTDKQQRFIDEYLTCWNGAEAARRAGYSSAGARQEAHRLLTNVDIRAAINDRLAESAMPAREVLARLTEHARGSMSEFLLPHGRGVGIDLKRASESGALHMVKKYNKTKDGVSIELYDAQAALQLLGRHHRLFADVTEHQGKIEIEYVNDWRNQE